MRLSVVLAAALALTTVDNGVVTSQASLPLQVVAPPVPVVVNGAAELVYELRVTNASPGAVPLTGLEVIDKERGTTVASFSAEALRHRIAPSETRQSGADPLVVPSGSSAVIYVEFSATGGLVPTSLRHRLAVGPRVGSNAVDERIDGGDVQVRREAPVVLGPPLRSGPWVAVYNAAWERGHRRVYYAIDGTPRIPGRFAIDWIKLDPNGQRARGSEDEVANVLGYGEDVLAVSNATVAATRDDVSEVSLVSARRKHAIEDASGNYVALELRPGRYVLYEHLKPGSVRVKGGQRVRKGQVIASLGFTGDSTGPHLHLHVGDAASPLGAEGLPFVFDRFTMLGVFTDMADLGKRRWAGAAGSAARQLERPAPGAVIDFGER
jgi:murein DD-endopeptidase MepM/ murein hydrolase activator NlpD